MEDIGWLSPGQGKICLLREKHESFLRAALAPFPLHSSYISLDASRSWMLYWLRSNNCLSIPFSSLVGVGLILSLYRHSLALLGAKRDPEIDNR